MQFQSTIGDKKHALKRLDQKPDIRMNDKSGSSGKRRDYEVSGDNSNGSIHEADLTAQPLDENPDIIAVPSENLSGGKANRKRKKRTKREDKKATIIDAVQSLDQTNMEERSQKNLAEVYVTEKRSKKRKSKKANVENDIPSLEHHMIDMDSTENLAGGNVTLEELKTKGEGQSMDRTRVGIGSKENFAEGNVLLKNPKIQEVHVIDQARVDIGPGENFADTNVTGKRKWKRKKSKAKIKDEVQREMDTRSIENLAGRNAKIKGEVQSLGQNKMVSGSTEYRAEGDVTIRNPKDTGPIESFDNGHVPKKRKKKRKNKAKIKDDVQRKMVVGSAEDLAEGNVTVGKPKIKVEVQSAGQTDKESMGNLAEGNVNIKDQKVNDEVQKVDQNKVDAGPSENSAEGNATRKRKKKRKIKVNSDVRINISTRLADNLGRGNAIEMPRTEDEIQSIGQIKMDAVSTENLTVGNVTIKNPKIQDDVGNMHHHIIITESTENSIGRNLTGKRKKWKRKVKVTDEVQKERETISTENIAQRNVTMEMPMVKEEVQSIGQTERNFSIIQDAAQGINQTKIERWVSENFAVGNATGRRKKKKKSNAKVNHDVQREMDTHSSENLGHGNATIEKPKINSEVETAVQTNMHPGSTENLGEGNVSSKNMEIQYEARIVDQIKMDSQPTENFSGGNVTRKRIRKRKRVRKRKRRAKGEFQMEMDTGSTENLTHGNVSIEKLKINDEFRTVLHTTTYQGSIENLAEGNVRINNPKIQDEAQIMGQIKMDTMPSENLAEGNMMTEKPNIEVEVQVVGRTKIETRSRENLVEGDLNVKIPRIQDESRSMVQTKMDVGPTDDSAKENVTSKRKKKRKKTAKNKDEVPGKNDRGSTENLAEGYITIKKPEIAHEVHSVGLTRKDTGSAENLADGNVTIKIPEITYEVQSVENTKMDVGPIGDFAEGNVSGGRKRKRKGKKKEKTEGQVISLSQGGSTSNLTCERITDSKLGGDCIDTCGPLARPMELKREYFPCESQIYHPHLPAELKVLYENGLNEICNAVILDMGKDSAERTVTISSAPITSFRRKLLVLDVNGLLADIVFPAPKRCSGDAKLYGRAVFKRPFCDDFLKFCFQNFDVGIWSSRTKRNIDKIVSFLLGDQVDKLLFCWDMEHATQTGFKTLENKHKPMVCKELRKIWENGDPNLPWKKGDYNQSNTLLLDDSPYKALLNPLHTAIFPDPYQYVNKNDNSLGPGGTLRVYLEGLLTSENVQKYVEQHPFGQRPITEESCSWEFYSQVLQQLSNPMDGKIAISNASNDKTRVSNDRTPNSVRALC